MTQSPVTQPEQCLISSETKILSGVVERMSGAITIRGQGPLTADQRELVEMAFGILNAYLARKGIATGSADWHRLVASTYDPWLESALAS